MNRTLRRRQLDAQVQTYLGITRSRPTRGWSAAVREAIGMSTRQLGERLGITQQSAAELEKAEVADQITLKNLRRLAKAMDADLVYGFVPRKSFEQNVRNQAERRAARVVERVETSMSLEDQPTASATQKQRKADLIEEFVRTTPRDLWDPE